MGKKVNLKRRKRFYMIVFMLLGVMVTVSLVLYALNNNINLYYTPSELSEAKAVNLQHLRIGGMVVKGSVHRMQNTLLVNFTVTDFKKSIPIRYEGVLPALFREGQGIVAEGSLEKSGVFIARQVLAKHDEKYMPPKIMQIKKR